MILGIFGPGSAGREILELANQINEKDNKWDRIVFLSDSKESDSIVCGCEVHNYEKFVRSYKEDIEIVIALGEIVDREKIISRLKKDSIKFATLVHPNVHIPQNSIISAGCIIQVGCFISCDVKIHDCVYLQPNCIISHDVVIGEGSFLAAQVNISGGVVVGDYCFIGINSAIRENVIIGNHCVIGMGSLVCEDFEENIVAFGQPAKFQKINEKKQILNHMKKK